MTRSLTYGFVLFILFFSSCQRDIPFVMQDATISEPVAPAHFPPPFLPKEDNKFTPARFELGRMLFYDTRLSRTQTVSCGSCHRLEHAMASDQAKDRGVENRRNTRNTPSLANVAWFPYFTSEGGVPTLEAQVFVPIQEHNEFDFNILDISERLQKDPNYVSLSQAAYGDKTDFFKITRALAVFERAMISSNSRYDAFLLGKTKLNPKEKEGMQLFFSERTQCASCHAGVLFTDFSFQNNGLHEVYEDIGRKRLTQKDEDLALFKVPSLRNCGVTAPYMRDGSISSLEAVVEHYNQGGKAHPSKSARIQALGLTSQEKAALVAFLHTLTDPVFCNNTHFKNPHP
jgi:cytochrome c peroxidase